MLLAGISLLSYRRRTALLWKVEGSSLFLCFFLQTIIKTVDSNVQLYFHIFIYCHFFIGEINLEISKRFKRLLYAILHLRPRESSRALVCWMWITTKSVPTDTSARLAFRGRSNFFVHRLILSSKTEYNMDERIMGRMKTRSYIGPGVR